MNHQHQTWRIHHEERGCRNWTNEVKIKPMVHWPRKVIFVGSQGTVWGQMLDHLNVASSRGTPDLCESQSTNSSRITVASGVIKHGNGKSLGKSHSLWNAQPRWGFPSPAELGPVCQVTNLQRAPPQCGSRGRHWCIYLARCSMLSMSRIILTFIVTYCDMFCPTWSQHVPAM